jgi:hypothetical protein
MTISRLIFHTMRNVKVMVKLSLYRPGQVLGGSRRLRLPEYLDSRHIKVVRLSALRTGRLYPQEGHLVLISVRGWVDSMATMRPEGLTMRNVSDKIVEKIKAYILRSLKFYSRKSCRTRGNVNKYCRAVETIVNIIERMYFEFWLSKATDSRSEYVIFAAFPLQQWLQAHASVLRYVYIACLVHINFQPGWRTRYNDWNNLGTSVGSGFDSWHGKTVFLFSKACRSSRGPREPPTQRIPGGFFLGGKATGVWNFPNRTKFQWLNKKTS